MSDKFGVNKINHFKMDIVNEMISVAKKYPFVKRLIIFGSSVTEHCSEESDIDVCVDVDCPDQGRDLHNLHVDLCKTCDANCDILIYHRLKGKIKDEIDKNGVVVYSDAQC